MTENTPSYVLEEIEQPMKRKTKEKRKKEVKIIDNINENQDEVTSSVNRMQLIAALSASCSNKIIIEAFSKIPFGKQMLDIFAEAVEKKIENMFSANIEKQQVNTKAIADEIYEKMKAVNESPAMHILRTLADGIVEGGNTPSIEKNNPSKVRKQLSPGGFPGANQQDILIQNSLLQSAQSESLNTGRTNGDSKERNIDAIKNSSLGF